MRNFFGLFGFFGSLAIHILVLIQKINPDWMYMKLSKCTLLTKVSKIEFRGTQITYIGI